MTQAVQGVHLLGSPQPSQSLRRLGRRLIRIRSLYVGQWSYRLLGHRNYSDEQSYFHV